MTLAIGQLYVQVLNSRTLSDRWTAVTVDNSCQQLQFEHTVLVTDSGCEILTGPKSGRKTEQGNACFYFVKSKEFPNSLECLPFFLSLGWNCGIGGVSHL